MLDAKRFPIALGIDLPKSYHISTPEQQWQLNNIKYFNESIDYSSKCFVVDNVSSTKWIAVECSSRNVTIVYCKRGVIISG